MTVRDDLATLRIAIRDWVHDPEAAAALSRVEDEVARLRDGLRPSRKDELIAGMVALADDLEAGRIFLQDFPPDMRKRLRRALLADQDGAALMRAVGFSEATIDLAGAATCCRPAGSYNPGNVHEDYCPLGGAA